MPDPEERKRKRKRGQGRKGIVFSRACVVTGNTFDSAVLGYPDRPGNFKMRSRPYITLLAIAFGLTNVLSSCGQFSDKKKGQISKSKNTTPQQFDTSKTAITPVDHQKGNYPFDKTYKPTTLNQDDIGNIDSLLIECVADFNHSLDKDHKDWSIDLNKGNYRKQLVAVINTNGEKEVWVNCFCKVWESNNWKTEILHVDDGGNCYFNFKINLTSKTFYSVSVNGEA